jgi:Dolichyl-phosphate-mannose-protein mannosyltransferase
MINSFSFFERMSHFSFAKRSIYFVLFFTALRLALSGTLELSNDESYYWTYSQHLQWNYFDHPPLVAIWIRFFTANLFLQQTFFIRLGSLVGCAISSYFIYKTIASIHSEKSAYVGVFLYNTSFYACITTGVLITPDTPQMVFWTCAMYMATKIIADDTKWKYWLLFGAAVGLSIMSKIHAIFLWQGMLAYALVYNRSWFAKPAFYISGLLTLLIFSPIIIWNINNDFITYQFHSARVTVDASASLHWFGLLKEIIGQLVINNPFNIICIIIFFRQKSSLEPNEKSALILFKLTSLPLLIIIFCIALFRSSLPHWSGPAYITLIPIAAIGLAQLNVKKYYAFFKASLAYSLIFILLINVGVNFYPSTYGSKNEADLGKGDISLDSYGWKEAGKQFAEFYNEKEAHKPTENRPPLVCNNWWGAHEEYFFARPLGIKMIGLGSINELHNYAWKNKITLPVTKMDTAYCIVHSDEYYDAKKTYYKYYSSIDSITTIKILRIKKPAHNFYVYQLTGYKKEIIDTNLLLAMSLK